MVAFPSYINSCSDHRESECALRNMSSFWDRGSIFDIDSSNNPNLEFFIKQKNKQHESLRLFLLLIKETVYRDSTSQVHVGSLPCDRMRELMPIGPRIVFHKKGQFLLAI